MNKARARRCMLHRCLGLLMVTGLALLLVNPVTAAKMPTLGGIIEAGIAIKEGISKITDPLSTARRVILQLGHEMDVKVEYQPEDAPKAIHPRFRKCGRLEQLIGQILVNTVTVSCV
jgi:hypothetical protein